MTQPKPRARDLGIPFDGTPGPWNAITDVQGVEVGHVTLNRDEPATGERAPVAVRTGVTAIHPLGKGGTNAVLGGWFSLNGNGEMTGTTFLDEFGTIYGPLAITNTLSVGLARDAVAAWSRRHVGFGHAMIAASLPVAAETWDGQLNDIFGFHVTREHVHRALETAEGGPVAEGNVGGGTGMTAYEFKSGIGTSSRIAATELGTYTVGVLVQSNYGKRPQLRIAGVPVGREIVDLMPERPQNRSQDAQEPPGVLGDGSIIAVVATDAPLLPNQLRALAKRVSLGLGRLGSVASHSSGDIFLAFSTAYRVSYRGNELLSLEAVPLELVDPLYVATIDATEESVVNALIAAETMTGAHGVTYHALPHGRLREALAKYGRLRA